MWLLNVQSLELEQHEPPSRDDLAAVGPSAHGRRNGSIRPQYAILSHRWSQDEVTFQDMKDHNVRQQKQGFHKIVRTCQLAKEDNISYVWIDTCCINKDSDAELSESINSMYTWYQAAQQCYAYLQDYSVDQKSTFIASEWFKRGWTLQELIAPRSIKFFDKSWTLSGYKADLRSDIELASSVNLALLDGSRRLEDFSVAERMGWAAFRQTTRAEDRAYSLLGIFGVSMPMLYGEGGLRAFRRLQEEIIKQNDDHSIFAWSHFQEPGNFSLLAHGPDAFTPNPHTAIQSLSLRTGRKPYAMTNRGISITLRMAPWCMETYLAVLHCTRVEQGGVRRFVRGQVAIFLHRLYEDDSFARVSVDGLSMLFDLESTIYAPNGFPLKFKDVLINVKQATLLPSEQRMILWKKEYGFRITSNLLGKHLTEDMQTKVIRGPDTTFDAVQLTLTKPNGSAYPSLVGTLDLRAQRLKIRMVRMYLDFEFNPVIVMAELQAASVLAAALKADREGYDAEFARDLSGVQSWSAINCEGADGRSTAWACADRTGLWVIKGDRLDGLDVLLGGLTIKNAEKSARLKVWRNMVPQPHSAWHEGEYRYSFWNVDIEGLRPRESA
ncbi:hypothetical protein AMS68_004190 [Peltaster fructicola]|uniref:Uncharacterized protein n=1 Tax=Peltaster fructicola TaxID=286661 RepID=A0A6H0XVA5_9PEZI|nr:hypothetical protein AMS68_004190 [Peltaster fructicola]